MRRIRAVFLDFYNTVARFDPPREQVQSRASAALGVRVDPTAVLRSYQAADEFLSKENGTRPLGQRSPDEVREFWARYEQVLLAGAGAEVDLATAERIFAAVGEYSGGFALFEDVKPTLDVLGARGYAAGLISNMNDDLWAIAVDLGIADHFSFAVTSRQVGSSKPNPPIFLEALKRSGAEAIESVHIGDQYLGDVTGARGVGIQPILIDRDGTQVRHNDCPVIRTLTEVPDLLKALETAS